MRPNTFSASLRRSSNAGDAVMLRKLGQQAKRFVIAFAGLWTIPAIGPDESDPSRRFPRYL
jgi:hypothetical protein